MYILTESDYINENLTQINILPIEKNGIDLKSKYYKADISTVLIYNAAERIFSNINIDINNFRFGIIIGTEFGVLNTQFKYIELLKQGINSSILFKQSSNNILSSLLAVNNNISCYTTTIFNGNTSGIDAIGLACIMLRYNLDMVLVGTVDCPTKFKKTMYPCAMTMLISNDNIDLPKKEQCKQIKDFKTCSVFNDKNICEILNFINNYRNDLIFCVGLNKKNGWQEKLVKSIEEQHQCMIFDTDNLYGVNIGLRCIKNISNTIKNFLVIGFEENSVSMLSISNA